MRTTQKDFVKQVQNHIIECLSTDETEVLKEQLENVIRDFNSWDNPNEQKRTPNHQERFKEFLFGLPSSLSIEYTYYNISETLKSWFIACGEQYTKRQQHDEVTLYLHLVTREFYKMLNKERMI